MKNLFVLFISIFSSLSCASQTWSTVGSGATNGRVQAMCVYHGELYVGGYFDSIGGLSVNSIARWDGIAWDSVPGAYAFYPFEIFDMVVYQNQLIVVGSEVRAWNDTSWTSLNLLDNRQFGAEVYNNELYVCGHFENAGGVPTRGVARWNGTAWDSVGGPGLNFTAGFVGDELHVFNGELYLGGGFNWVNGIPIQGIARWNGVAWDSVDASQGSYISCMETYNNRLYAGGNVLIQNPGEPMGVLNGQQWDSVGNGPNWGVYTLTEYASELYAMGKFDSVGNQQMFGIARWNDSVWANVGTGLDSLLTNGDTTQWGQYWSWEQINVGCVYNNELYVGGTFISIGGLQATNIARWHMIGASIDDGETTQTVSVFPNPANNEITFQFGDADESRSVVIYNSAGQAVGKYSANQNTLQISTAEYAEGIYFFNCIGENTESRCKFVITH